MANYINKYTNIEAYNADEGKQYPNVSYLVATDEIKWVKDDPVHIVCKYNVTSTESATKLLQTNSGITYQIIDGVRQSSVQSTYIFDTLGEHTVKYKLSRTSIGDNVFRECSSLTSITIPASVTKIGDSAFTECSSLTSITIPASVTSIGDYVFSYSPSLTSITIPASVTSIGDYVFTGCIRLTNVTIKAVTPPTLSADAFFITNANLIIYVPSESLETYKNATNWSSLASRIKPISE